MTRRIIHACITERNYVEQGVEPHNSCPEHLCRPAFGNITLSRSDTIVSELCSFRKIMADQKEAKPIYDSKWQYWSLVILIYACLVCMGVVENARSVTFVAIKQYFSVPYDTYGLFNSCLSVAYIGFCAVASYASEYVNYKVIIIVGYILIDLGCYLTHFMNSFFLVSICMFMIWLGFGFFEIGANASATLVFVENKGTLMSLMHFFFGLGAVAGPNIATWSAKTFNNSFYSMYFSIGCVVLAFLIVSLFLPFKLPRSGNEKEESKPSMTVTQALLTPTIWLCSITMGLGNAIEASGAQWAPLYLVDILGLTADDVTSFSTVLYIIFTISRLVSGPIIDRLGYYRSLFISYTACFLLLLVGFFLGKNGIWLFAAAGFFYSANWPIFICVVVGFYKESAATATSVIIILQGLVTLPLSYILGLLNEYCGKYWAYRLTLAFCALAALCLSCVYMCQKRKERREEAQKSKSEVNVEMTEKKEVKDAVKENEKEEVKETIKQPEQEGEKVNEKVDESPTAITIPNPVEQ